MNAVRCITCERFNLHDAGRDWAVLGFGMCEANKGEAYRSAKYARECSTFIPASAESVEKRENWLKEKKL